MEKILKQPKFQETLTEIARQQGQSLTQVQAEAKAYIKELQTKHEPIADFIGVQLMEFIVSRGYDKTIDVNPLEIKKLAKVVRRHPVAFVMTHKTYIDMFVLALVLFRHGLPLPYIFAGINMAFFGIGQFGRQTGAIFIRRGIKDNAIYKATLRHYIAYLVDEKAHFMWAIEGTRSRTGKLVWPKMGILKYIMDAEKDAKDVVKYVPVSIVYDLIPDVAEMTQEMRGKEKKAESLKWFIDYVRKLGDNFGKVSIRFGEAIEAEDQHTARIPLVKSHQQEHQKGISLFAFELVHRINQVTPVTTTSFICISLLSKFALSKRAIESDIAAMMQFIESNKPESMVDRGTPIGESVQKALNILMQGGLIQKQGEGHQAKYAIVSENYLQATYYANMAVHHLYHQAFIELAFVKINSLKSDRAETFWTDIMFLRDLFKFEFFYSRKATFTDEIEENLAFLDDKWETKIANNRSQLFKLLERQKVLVAPVVLYNYIEAYRVVVFALQKWDVVQKFNEKIFIEKCIFLGEEMHWQGNVQRLEAVSKPFILNGIRLVKNMNLIPTKEDDKKEAITDFLAKLDDVGRRIRIIQEITLSKPQEKLLPVPIEREIVPGSKTDALTKEIMDAESGAHIGAFFDLDRTLIKDFSAKEFFKNRILSGQMTRREIIAQFSGVLVYATKDRNFAAMAAMGAKGVKGVPEKVFIEVGEEVYLKHLAGSIFPEARAMVAAHMAKGHTVAIISAATPYQVDPIARDLNIKHVMCTRMEVKNGKFTGNIIEPACWGEGKAHAARDLVNQFDLDLSKSYFYTDSAEDLPLLEIVGHPRPMNPDTRLSALAFENDWPVYRFDDENRASPINIARTVLAAGSLIPAILSGLTTGTMKLNWNEGVNSMMAAAGDLVTKFAGTELVVKGEENLWSHRPAVFILNHQSSMDMFIAAKLIRRDARGIAKKSLKHMPIIGQMLQAGGAIFIDRVNREKAIEAMKPAVDALKGGTSVIIFPEGTRSKSYKLGKFKKGAFHLAMQAGVPIVPIIITNAIDSIPEDGGIFKPAAVEVKILTPIPTLDWTLADLDQNINWIRGMYLQELGQI
ncbi:MAG: HAD-IB family hydrolase [Bacteroidota bacterium]